MKFISFIKSQFKDMYHYYQQLFTFEKIAKLYEDNAIIYHFKLLINLP